MVKPHINSILVTVGLLTARINDNFQASQLELSLSLNNAHVAEYFMHKELILRLARKTINRAANSLYVDYIANDGYTMPNVSTRDALAETINYVFNEIKHYSESEFDELRAFHLCNFHVAAYYASKQIDLFEAEMILRSLLVSYRITCS